MPHRRAWAGSACHRIRRRFVTGEPGREICGVVAEVGARLVVLFSSRHTRAASGPRSVGHTARFVLDHAACPVLLVRGR
jgi:nucleotide-binding universal stress UspA family protein